MENPLLNARGFDDVLIYEYHLHEVFNKFSDSFEDLENETYIAQIKSEKVSTSEIRIKIGLTGTYVIKEDR